MLKKNLRLRRNKDFSYTYRKGIKFKGKYVSIYKLKKYDSTKVGFSLSKKVGNAVVRNLWKRRLHEIFRLEATRLKPSYYSVVALPNIKEATFKELKNDVLSLIDRMNR